ncbi:MAG: 3-deoxy-7-phosphoheptulonate synthase, partial [Gammaproteobacteria bacterium]|nr:3-deoxy-7-phosphoheptulonate synthase [Gammaproteobacteria bacterium]
MVQTDDLRIVATKELSSPTDLINELPVSEDVSNVVDGARRDIRNVLMGADDRLVVIVGPCSVHDVDAAYEYAQRLAKLKAQYKDDLVILMRVYFEKPRTIVGWKGLVNDPDLDGTFDINKGLRMARKLLLDINALGLAAGNEFLDLISPQYIADLIGWGAIGARTTESQSHRELASGLSCPVGFKNGTGGSIQIAVDAIRSANHSHHFLSVTKDGRSAIFATAGNSDCHIILRGGGGTNYDWASVDDACSALRKSGCAEKVMIDFSHANSRKIPERQDTVCRDVELQISGGDQRIMGVMIESHLVGGRQDLVDGKAQTYGQSITDACVDWDMTEDMLARLAAAVSA